ncbi:MAG TPA: methionyl-tRNA formyltransferase [Ignavibacteriales bacterium]|nr:methionyl-tRNA formyltransferase [Ignavibacteriales bacterium]
MKIVFFGVPDFTLPALRALLKSKHEIAAVVTGTDKERGRGRKISYTPVKEFGIENSIPVLQPEKLRDEKFIADLKNIGADIFIVVAFKILPPEVFTIPKHGSFNLHASLLPKYRGAAPIQWAIINGEKETGLTTFFLQEKVDTGNVILQEKMSIGGDEDFGSLHDRMSELGAGMILKTLELIESGAVQPKKQEDAHATPAPKITKETCLIDWNKTAFEAHNLVRGLSPAPAAFFMHGDKQIKVYRTKINTERKLNPGEIYETKSEIIVGCGKDSLELLELQLEGRKRLNAEDFLRGNKLT